MIAANVGDVFTVELKSTPTTGYQWQRTDLPAGVELLDADFVPAPAPRPGEGGIQYFRLHAKKPGRYELTFQLKRSWEPDPISTHTVEVRVT
jgi:predicted secreted protein